LYSSHSISLNKALPRNGYLSSNKGRSVIGLLMSCSWYTAGIMGHLACVVNFM
jgi:hypothetical protein